MKFPKPEKRLRAPKTLRRSVKPIRTNRPPGTKRAEAKDANQIDPDTWDAVVRFYGGRCAYCPDGLHEQQDHQEPIAHGGLNVIQNCFPICARCNANKGTSRHWEPRFRHPYTQEPR